jgi:hypothetical protein
MATERDAERAVSLYERELSAHPNVVGIGVRPVEEPQKTGYQVAVYVSQKNPDVELPESLDVPVGDSEVSVPVTVIESGEFTFE